MQLAPLPPVPAAARLEAVAKPARLGGPVRVAFASINAFAPVLGGGRFTQPGADGGERLTHHT